MAMTAMQSVQGLAKEHGISIHMVDDYLRDVVLVIGSLGDRKFEHAISMREILSRRVEDMDDLYATKYRLVIDELLKDDKGSSSKQRIAQLEAELAKYKSTVKSLSFQLEMSNRGGFGSVVKEDEVRRLALEQAAEHLMDHGVITSGKELVEVCEQIKKLQSHDIKMAVLMKGKSVAEWELPL